MKESEPETPPPAIQGPIQTRGHHSIHESLIDPLRQSKQNCNNEGQLARERVRKRALPHSAGGNGVDRALDCKVPYLYI